MVLLPGSLSREPGQHATCKEVMSSGWTPTSTYPDLRFLFVNQLARNDFYAMEVAKTIQP